MSNLLPGDEVSPAEAGRLLREQAAAIVQRSKTVNKYRLQGRDSDEYFPSNLRQINRMIEHGQAVWVGTDPGPGENEVTHYADRRFHE